jgi:hypothetical protein
MSSSSSGNSKLLVYPLRSFMDTSCYTGARFNELLTQRLAWVNGNGRRSCDARHVGGVLEMRTWGVSTFIEGPLFVLLAFSVARHNIVMLALLPLQCSAGATTFPTSEKSWLRSTPTAQDVMARPKVIAKTSSPDTYSSGRPFTANFSSWLIFCSAALNRACAS